MSTSRPTFIVGHPRSGTSLLRALLDGHPDLLVFPFESHLFDWVESPDPVSGLLARTRLWPTLQTHRPSQTEDGVKDALKEAFEGARDPRSRLLALVEGWRGLMGAGEPSRWVEKTPRHLFEAPTLLEWFPEDARILVIRRDPRDVMASQLKQKGSRPIFGMALSARIAHEMTMELATDERVHILAYEELVSDTKATMIGVSRFLGIPEHPFVLRPTVLGAAYGGNSRFDSSISGISGAPVGRFRTLLSPPQLKRAEALLEPVLRTGGYGSTLAEGRTSPWRHFPSSALLWAMVRSRLWSSRGVRTAFKGF